MIWQANRPGGLTFALHTVGHRIDCQHAWRLQQIRVFQVIDEKLHRVEAPEYFLVDDKTGHAKDTRLDCSVGGLPQLCLDRVRGNFCFVDTELI